MLQTEAKKMNDLSKRRERESTSDICAKECSGTVVAPKQQETGRSECLRYENRQLSQSRVGACLDAVSKDGVRVCLRLDPQRSAAGQSRNERNFP